MRKFLPPLAMPILLGALFALAGGCVQRTMKVSTDPDGAVVWMNNQELGRTPVEHDFTWYGTYDVQVRKEGYEMFETKQRVVAPWWQWPPFDFFAELWPGHFKDIRQFHYTLSPASTQPADPGTMLVRAAELRVQLESSKFTRLPTTGATTVPTTSPATAPATMAATQPTTAPTTQAAH